MTITAFESTGAWTTYPEYLTFTSALLAAYPTRLSKVPMTTSTQGREVFAIRVGAPSASGAALLIDASIHGNEQAPREAMMILMRELAEATDPAIIALLDAHPLYLTCISPDGWTLDTRDDSTGTNPNRIHLSLFRREVRALAELVRDTQPVAALNGHEYPVVGGDDQGGAQLTTWPAFFGPTHPLVHAAGVEISQTALWPAAQDAGFTTGWYPEGTGSPTTWQAAAGMKNIVVTLVETNRYDLTELERVQAQLVVMRAWIKYMTSHIEDIASSVELARRESASQLGRGLGLVTGGNHALPGAWPASRSPAKAMAGYVIAAAKWASNVPPTTNVTYADIFAAHGITTFDYNGDRWVPLGQPLAPLLNAVAAFAAGTSIEVTPAQFASPHDTWGSIT